MAYSVVVVLGAILAWGLYRSTVHPYGDSANGKPVQVVKVVGQQFAWKITPSTVVAGKKVRFDVVSTDVNHGFGVYTSGLTYLFQVQSVPNQTTSVFHTCAKPGSYKVLCLEFCGRSGGSRRSRPTG